MRTFAEVTVLATRNDGRKYVCLTSDPTCKFWLDPKETYYDKPDHNVIRLNPKRLRMRNHLGM